MSGHQFCSPFTGLKMIIGIGTDLVDIRRIERVLERSGEAFCRRIYTQNERALCDARGAKSAKKRASAYAMRFAAKEACSKALGTGLSRGVFWRDMENANLAGGQPILTLTGGALKRLNELTPAGKRVAIHVSMTDEYPMAQAVVILSAEDISE